MLRLFSVFFCLAIPLLAEPSMAEKNAEFFQAWTLVPPLVAIALAFITKEVIFSLFIGVLSGTYLLALKQTDAFLALSDAVVNATSRMIGAMADPWNAGIILQVLTIGGVVALITRMGGTKALAEALAKRAKNSAMAQVYTWLMGIIVFFDDYANALIAGPVMRPVADKFKISREKLAFIVDATAAPISGIAIVSTWVGYEISVIKQAYEVIGITDVNAFAIFVETIPYRFYNIFMLGFVLFSALSSRDFGPMYQAQKKALKQGNTYVSEQKMNFGEEQALNAKPGVKLCPYNAIIPIFVLIISSLVGFYFNGVSSLDKNIIETSSTWVLIREAFGAADASVVLFQAAIFSTIVAMFMGVYRKIFSIREAIEVWVKGWESMIITIIILLLAWSLSSIIKEVGTSRYLVEILSGNISTWILPAIIFILGSLISFSTGTAYGTMGIIMPLAIPLAHAIGVGAGFEDAALHQYIVMNVGSVLTGAIFGDHCSPISDTTILSSMGAGCDHMSHVRTQIVYALSVGVITVIMGYIPVGFNMNVWLVLPMGLFATYLFIRIVGKKVA